MATEIKDRFDLARWLKGRPVADARVIASRAALRVLPLISGIDLFLYDRRRNVELSVTSIFRASSLAWVACKYPTQTNELSLDKARGVADYALWASVLPADIDPVQLPAIFDTANAAFAAAAAVRTAYYADAANSSANAVNYAATGDIEEQVWQSVSADALALAESLAPDILANRPLWSGGIPQTISVEWQRLNEALPPNEDWDIWTAWYDRRLTGRVYSESYELVFARVPDEEWEKGPAAANAWIKAELAKLEHKAIPNVASVFTFGWNEANRIALSSGPQNLPVFPFPGNEPDHRRRLEAERTQVERLISDIAHKQANIRPDYVESLRRYAGDLPDAPGTGNFLLADGEARILRALFESEADFLPQGFAARLKIVLEQHIALRAFYPEVERLYLDVRTGRLEEPLPQDAVEKATRTIAQNTPSFFEPEVTAGLKEVEREPPQISLSEEDRAAHAPGVILPPADPIGTLDLKKTRDVMTAGTFNKLFEFIEKGDKIAKGLAGWETVSHQLRDNIGPIIDWLSRNIPIR